MTTQEVWLDRMDQLGESLELTVAVDRQWANTGVVRFRQPGSFTNIAAVHYGFYDDYASFDVRDNNDAQMIPTPHGVGYCSYERRRPDLRPFEEKVQMIEAKIREMASASATTA